MQIICANTHDKERWNAYIHKYPDFPPLNIFEWKEILEKSYRIETHFFAALNDNNAITAICPTYIIRDIRGRKNLCSLLFSLIADNKEVLAALISSMRNFCEKNNIVATDISAGYRKEDLNCKEKIKITHIIEIAKDQNTAWLLLRDKTRNMIRRSVKNGLVAEKGFHNIKDFYEIYARNMLDKGIPIHSLDYFLKIRDLLQDKSELIVARKGDTIVGGILVFFSKNTAIYPYQSSLKESLVFAPNQFLIWETIKLCIDKGIYRLDMGWSKKDSSVYKFKSNFGGKPESVYYYDIQANPAHGGIEAATNLHDGNKKRFNFTVISKKVLVHSPYWLGKKIGVWLKTKSKIQ